MSGFRRLTLAGVSASLNVSTSALYHHVRDRDELVELAVDHVVSAIVWPDPDLPWRDYLAGCGTSLWKLLAAHEGLAEVAAGFVRPPAAVARRFEDAVVVLQSCGFTVEDAVLAVGTVLNITVDTFGRSVTVTQDPEDRGKGRSDTLVEVNDPELRRHLASLAVQSPRGWFERRLNLVLGGVSLLDSCPTRPAGHPSKHQSERTIETTRG